MLKPLYLLVASFLVLSPFDLETAAPNLLIALKNIVLSVLK